MVSAGQRYGKFYVQYENSINPKTWMCECACGNHMILRESEILNEYCERACLESRGEHCAEDIFRQYNIKYETQKVFPDSSLSFDFYLPEYNCVIECDGAQHFRAFNDWQSDTKLQETRNRDKQKDNYCSTHNIKLIRIPFWDHDKFNIDYLRKEL